MQSFSDLLSVVAKTGLKHVQWTSSNLGDDDLALLIGAMKVSPIFVEQIDLSKNDITCKGACLLAEYLVNHPSVREVLLFRNKINDKGAKAFVEVFRNEVYPSVFDIAENPCSKSFVQNMALLAQSHNFTSDVRRGLLSWETDELDLTGNDYNKLDPRLVNFFVENVSGLKKLILSKCLLGDGAAGLIGALIKESQLTDVDLSFNDISDVGVSQFVEHSDLGNHPTVTWISFAGNIRIGNYTAQQLPKILFEKNARITHIDLSETSCTSKMRSLVDLECELNKQPLPLKLAVVQLRKNDPACTCINFQWEDGMEQAANFIAPVLRENKHLTELNLGNSFIGDKGVELLSSALKHHHVIRVIALANNDITSRGAKALFLTFQQHPSIEEVNVASNKICDESAATILTTLRLNNQLKVVNLINNYLSTENMNEIEGLTLINQSPKAIRKLLAEIEANNSSLTTLSLSQRSGDEYYNDASVRLLCQALLLNNTVTCFDLSGNVVGDIGVDCIAEMLIRNSTITNLILADNSMTSRGAQCLCTALRTNASVRQLDLSTNAIHDYGVEGFPEMLRFNHVLLQVKMDHTGITQDMKTQIKEAADLNKEPSELKGVVYKLLDGDKTLTKIDLRRDNCSKVLNDQSIETLSIHLSGKCWVTHLILRGNSVGNGACKALGDVLTHKDCGLLLLDLSENPIENAGLDELSKSLLSNNTLEVLDLRETAVTSIGIDQLTETLKVNGTLQQVITPDAVSADAFCAMNHELMINAQPPSLKKLLERIEANEDIHTLQFRDPGTTFGDPAVQLLSASLVKNTHVVCIDMSGNQFTSDCVPFLAEAIAQCQSLKSVDLTNNLIDDRGGRLFLKMLTENDHLLSLELQRNSVTDDTLARIKELLFLNAGSIILKKTLLKHRLGKLDDEILDLNARDNDYKLNDDDVRILCGVLMESKTLRACDLGLNKITDVGCVMLAEVLRHNHTLEALYLDYNPIAEEGGEALYNSLKINPQLHTLYLEGTEVPQSIWEDILSLLHVNETPLKERIDMRSLPFEEVNDNTQFKSTDYADAQEKKIHGDAMLLYDRPPDLCLLKN